MSADEALERGRDSFRREAFGEAYTHLSAADAASPLGADDLERLAAAAHILGRADGAVDAWTRAHHGRAASGDAPRAARCAVWIAFTLLFREERARYAGWISRARRLLDEGGHDCVEHGYLTFLEGLRATLEGDVESATERFARALEAGTRFGDADLVVLARNGQGRALIRRRDTARGIALLDEVMVAVTAGEVSPILVAPLYCNMIAACREVFDLGRAQEWTDALAGWCASRGDPVPYRGQCLVHRSEILQVRGAWAEALEEALKARDCLSQTPGNPACGAAFYQLGELRRLRGELSGAEQAYREASLRGREPQPGLALLWLAQGRVEAAAAAIRRAVDETRVFEARAAMLSALVEIELAAGDVGAAEAAAGELSSLAAALDAPYLRGTAAHAAGRVLLARERSREALAALRRACDAWRELEAPYEGARARVDLALACRALGDESTAGIELDAAGDVLRRLGAAADLARLRTLSPGAPAASPGLTPRELEVLKLVATGRTNRAIAEELGISEKTVARHLANLFTKLGLSTRAAATAYAYEHGLL